MTRNQFYSIAYWQNKTFPNANVSSKLHHLLQEVDELSNAKDDLNIQEEFADCFILLFGAASSAGFSYSDICNAIESKMQINYKRQWGKPDENGVVNHIK